MRRDALLLVAVIAAALVLLNPQLDHGRESTDVYVSTNGSDWNSGRSAESALATIQRAADIVRPGQAVLILPGTYHESVRVRRGGLAGLPVVFKAVKSGSVTISGAAREEEVRKLQWRSEGGKVWSAKTAWPVYHVIGDGENFYHVRWANGQGDAVYDFTAASGRRMALREVTDRPNAGGAFTFEEGRLYAAFPDGRSPAEHDLKIHREIPPPYASWSIRSANVRVEAAHVRFEGIAFSLGVGAGMLLWDAKDVAVRNCSFTGAMFGISGFPRVRLPRDLLVEHSFYTNYPQYRWQQSGWLSGEEIYSFHSNSTLVGTYGDGLVARYNLVTHAADGMQLSTPESGITKGVEIHGNLLAGGTDDAFELDGYAVRIDVLGNLVSDFQVGLGLSPVLAGPVRVQGNAFVHAPGTNGASIKLMNPWASRGGELGGPIRNITIQGNVFGARWPCYCGARLENVRIAGNVFVNASDDERFRLPPGPLTHGNTFVETSQAPDSGPRRCELATSVHPGPQPWPAGEAGSSPGPDWLDLAKDPATLGIGRLLPQWAKVAGECE